MTLEEIQGVVNLAKHRHDQKVSKVTQAQVPLPTHPKTALMARISDLQSKSSKVMNQPFVLLNDRKLGKQYFTKLDTLEKSTAKFQGFLKFFMNQMQEFEKTVDRFGDGYRKQLEEDAKNGVVRVRKEVGKKEGKKKSGCKQY